MTTPDAVARDMGAHDGTAPGGGGDATNYQLFIGIRYDWGNIFY